MANQLTRGTLFDDLFRDIAPGFFVRPLHGDPLPTAAQIKIDVSESDSAYTVLAEVPGVGKEDINVSIDGSVVTLRRDQAQDRQSEGERCCAPSAITARFRAASSCRRTSTRPPPRPSTTTAC